MLCVFRDLEYVGIEATVKVQMLPMLSIGAIGLLVVIVVVAVPHSHVTTWWEICSYLIERLFTTVLISSKEGSSMTNTTTYKYVL